VSPVDSSLSGASYASLMGSGLALGRASATQTKPGKTLDEVASQFEGLLIGQLLKTAREADEGGWMGTDADEAGSSIVELAEQQLASALASHGGFGLAKLVKQGLIQKEKSAGPEPTK
jgi:Rod binding domain-containing protein